MTSVYDVMPTRASAPDLILLALIQSRLRERSQYLGQVIRTQRQRAAEAEAAEGEMDRVKSAEQALAAVQEAEARIGRGRYGLCDGCHEPIAMDELLQSPEQTLCRSCSQFGSLEGIRFGS